MSERQTGSVKWFNRVKGFGFINPDDGSQEVLFITAPLWVKGIKTFTKAIG